LSTSQRQNTALSVTEVLPDIWAYHQEEEEEEKEKKPGTSTVKTDVVMPIFTSFCPLHTIQSPSNNQ
jgi:hypothetical protein